MQDIKVINILINSKRELGDFFFSGGEGIFLPKYRRFIKNLLLYYKSYNSCPTLNTLQQFIGKNEELRGYLQEIWDEAEKNNTDIREFNFLIEELKLRYNQNILNTLKTRLNNNEDTTDTNKLLYKVVNEIQNINRKKIYDQSTLKESVQPWIMNFRTKIENPENSQGILTGFQTIDYYLNGLKGSELFLIGADSGAGKSIFLLDLATNCFIGKNELCSHEEAKNKSSWEKAYNVLYISLEMGKDELQNRILSKMSRVNSLNIDKGKIDVDEVNRIKKSLAYWEYSPYELQIIDLPRGCSMAQVQNIYDECCLSFKPDIVIIDYLGLMIADATGDIESDWQKLKDVAEQMHEFARVNNIPVVSAVQLKTTKPGTAGIGLHRIGRSSMIAHNANFVFQIEQREDEEKRVDCKIHCIKNRRGPLFTMNNIRKEFQYTKFVDNGNIENKDNVVVSNEDLTEAINLLIGGNNGNKII